MPYGAGGPLVERAGLRRFTPELSWVLGSRIVVQA
jgi:hypothetical protein